jgi:hypothetical protein
MKKTAIQRRIEQVVTKGRGYDPNNLQNDDNLYFSTNTPSGLDLALVNMDFRDGRANQNDVDAQVKKVWFYKQEILDTAMYGKIGTIDSSIRKIMIRR